MNLREKHKNIGKRCNILMTFEGMFMMSFKFDSKYLPA